MPELAEVEAYRRLAEGHALRRPIAEVLAADEWYLKGGLTAPVVTAMLVGHVLVRAERRGKLLLLPTDDDGPVLGLRFGMSGRLVVDGMAGVDDLWYGSKRDEPRWNRFALVFADGGRLVMSDPRRLGGVTLDPTLSRMGPDALTITLGQLRHALAPVPRKNQAKVGPVPDSDPVRIPVTDSGSAPALVTATGSAVSSGSAVSAGSADGVSAGPATGSTIGTGSATGSTFGTGSTPGPAGLALTSRMSLKGRLMDQSRLAGVGNLAADEILWRAGLAPTRPASSLTQAEVRRLHRHLRSTLKDFLERGGSHTGELMVERHPGGLCPKDGTPLVRATVATRTTWWCPRHQR